MADASSILGRLLSMSEERFGVAVADLLGSERFARAFEAALESGAMARSGAEKGLARMLQLLNVPTLADLNALETKLEELEELLGEIGDELQALEASTRQRGGRRPAGRRKPRPADGDSGT